MLKKLSDTLSRDTYIVHILFWIFFAGLFFLAISRVETTEKSFLIVGSVFLPMVPAVYLHFWIFNRLLRKKKFLFYFPLLLALIYVFGLAIEWTAWNFAFKADDTAVVAGQLSVLTMIVVSVVIRLFFEGMAAKNKLSEIEAARSRAELDSLKMQVNPHFLFNSLNNIYGLLMEDQGRAGDSLLTLSGLLRYLIYSGNQPRVSLEDEVKFIEDYVAMERLRLGEKCRIEVKKLGDFSGKQLPPFMLIPFLENAFKHGTYSTVEESFIKINLEAEDNRLSFEIRNSFKTPKDKSNGGLGIANVQRRLELEMPNKHTLGIEKVENVFTVKLQLEV